MAATYKVYVDWYGNNTFTDATDDVTRRVLDGRTTVTARYGRDQARQLSPTAPGELNFELNNISKDYSPENASSPLAGFVAPAAACSCRPPTAASAPSFTPATIDDMDVKPGINDQSVPVTCIDVLGRLRGLTLSTPLYRGIRTGEAVGYLLDAAGWPSDARDLDAGATVMPHWWLDETDAFEALMQLADSEGPAALITVDGGGRVVFRDRHHRLTRAASLTAQATWRSSGTEPCISDPVTYNAGWSEIVNSVSVEVPIRTRDASATTVWSSQGLLSVPAGIPVNVTARASTPFQDAIVPLLNTDFGTPSGSVTVSLSRTSGQSTTITLTSAAGAVVQDLQLRATAIQAASVVVTVEDAPSIAKYGRKSFQNGRLPVWANPYDAEAILTLIVSKRAERLPTLQVTMRGAGHALRLAECLGRNLSDRVHVTESLTGLDSDCYIEQIAHAVSQGGLEHVTTFGLEKIPPVVSTPLTFDVAGRGFDDGKFAITGADNPATMFRFDTAGVGFDQGAFST
jgi:hypothetical protein